MTQPSRKQQVAKLTERGRSPREIAAALEISTQRVYQILKELNLEPAGPKRRAS